MNPSPCNRNVSNPSYALQVLVNQDRIRDRPEIHARARKLAAAMLKLKSRTDRLRAEILEALPPDLSESLVPKAEGLIAGAGEDLQQDLYALFRDELEAAAANKGSLS